MNARSQGPHQPRQSQPNQPQTEAQTAIMDCTNCGYNTNWITALTTRKFVTATTISPITPTRQRQKQQKSQKIMTIEKTLHF